MKNTYIYVLFACLLISQQVLASEANESDHQAVLDIQASKHTSDNIKFSDATVISGGYAPVNQHIPEREDLLAQAPNRGPQRLNHQDIVYRVSHPFVDLLCWILNCCEEDDGVERVLLIR